MQLYPGQTDQVPEFWVKHYEQNASAYWDTFYKHNQREFFKDRHWLSREFPILTQPNVIVLEVGCGVGNTSLPVAKLNDTATIYSCDYASTAVRLLTESPDFDRERMTAFVADITRDDLTAHVPASVVDVVTCIFVLSANAADSLPQAVRNLRQVVKAGTGRVVVRDYATGDLAEERFAVDGRQKKLSDNFFVRGDGTRCLYFSEEVLRELFEREGFVCEDLRIHERVVENRKRNLSMHRRWIQASFVLRQDAPPAHFPSSDHGRASALKLTGAAARVATQSTSPRVATWSPGVTWRSQLPDSLDPPERAVAEVVGPEASARLLGSAADEALEAEFRSAVARDAGDVLAQEMQAAASRGRTIRPRCILPVPLLPGEACGQAAEAGGTAGACASSVRIMGKLMQLRPGVTPSGAELELAAWIASRPELLRERRVVDFGSGTSCACAFAAVQHCASYTYVCPTAERRSELRQQWSASSSQVICERAKFVLASAVLRGRRQAGEGSSCYDVAVLRVADTCSAVQAVALARELTSSQGVAVLTSDTGNVQSQASSMRLQVLQSSAHVLALQLE